MAILSETLRGQLGQYVDYCIAHIEKIERQASKDAITSTRVVAAFREMNERFIKNPSAAFVFRPTVLMGLRKNEDILENLNELVSILQGTSDIVPLPVNLDGAGRPVGGYSLEELRALQHELCACVSIKVDATIKNLKEKREETKQEHAEIKRKREEIRAENLVRMEQARRRNTFEGALELVRQNGLELERLAPILQNNRDIVVAAVTQNGRALQFAHPRLQNDNGVVRAALQHEDSDFILEHVGEAFRANREQLLQAIRDNEMAIGYGEDALVEDRSFIIYALRENPMVLQLLSEPLRNDYELVAVALESLGGANQEMFIEQIVGNEIRPRILAERQRGNDLIAAARSGDIDRVQAFLSTGDISEQFRTIAAREALIITDRDLTGAELHDRLQSVIVLLESGATISDELRGFAVEMAAKEGYLEITRAFLANGLISEKDRGRAVKMTARCGHTAIVRDLLTNGTISEDDRGRAVLGATAKGYLEIVQILLANRALISEDNRGEAVKNAAARGYLEIVRVLLESGALICKEDRGDAVGYAAARGHLEIVNLLLENGALISEEDRGEAVRVAAPRGYLEIVKALLAKRSIAEEDRKEALINAAHGGHLEIVQALLENRVISKEDREEAIRVALHANHKEIADLLKQSAHRS
jgi:hypothetical protein